MSPSLSAEGLQAFDRGPRPIVLPDFAMPGRNGPPPPIQPDTSAFERGVAEATARLAAAHAAEIAAVQQQTADALAAARSAWAAEEGGQLRKALETGLDALQSTISAELAALLTPFVSQACRTRVVTAFAAALTRALDGTADEGKPPFRLSGPPDLLEACALALGPLAGRFAFQPEENAIELVTSIGRTQLRSRLATVTAALARDVPP